MISENNIALLKQKCIDIANAFYDSWAAVGKAVDRMLADADVLKMYDKTVKFGVQPSPKEYEAKYDSHGYCFGFVYNCNVPNKFVLEVLWDAKWSYVSGCSGPDNLVLGTESDYSIDIGIDRMVRRLAATASLSLIKWKDDHDISIFKNFTKGAVEATNNLIRLMTDAYNKALDLESKNDNIILSAFELNADGPAHVKPKKYDVKIVERKTKCASMQV